MYKMAFRQARFAKILEALVRAAVARLTYFPVAVFFPFSVVYFPHSQRRLDPYSAPAFLLALLVNIPRRFGAWTNHARDALCPFVCNLMAVSLSGCSGFQVWRPP